LARKQVCWPDIAVRSTFGSVETWLGGHGSTNSRGHVEDSDRVERPGSVPVIRSCLDREVDVVIIRLTPIERLTSVGNCLEGRLFHAVVRHRPPANRVDEVVSLTQRKHGIESGISLRVGAKVRRAREKCRETLCSGTHPKCRRCRPWWRGEDDAGGSNALHRQCHHAHGPG